jgi:hypothetical protein
MNQEKAQLQKVINRLSGLLPAVRRYRLAAFIVFVVLIYSLILFRIHTLSTAQPTADQVSSQVKAARIPHIDQSVVQQLQSLQDNSVNVQALFNQARNNPFQ